MQEKEIRKNIINDFSKVDEKISDLVESRYFFRSFLDFSKNNKILRNSSFMNIALKNYRDLMILEVCKEIDKDDRSLSLFRVLNNLKENSRLFDLNWFISNYPKNMKEFAKRDFKQFSIKNNKKISSKKIDQDLKDLKLLIQGKIFGRKRQSNNSIKKLRNKKIAHRDRKTFVSNATINDLNSAIDFLEKLILKYELLFIQSSCIDNSLLSSNINDFIDFDKIFIKN